MKTYVWGILGLLLSILTTVGCDDTNEKMYGGDATLYLNLSSNQLDSMAYSFVGVTEDRIIVKIPVEITGYATASDRSFGLKVNESLTTAVAGKHYEALQDHYILGKEKYHTDVPLTLLCSGDLDTTVVRLVLNLEAGEEFSAGIAYRQQVIINFSNQVPEVKFWDWLYFDYFGKYSKEKHRHILKVLKLEKLEDYREFLWEMNEKLWKAYGQHMNNYFADHQIYDEHNQLIEPWIK